ncbi:hypothetical protein Pcinc_037068 [Petrolisthes cinctipes]|uniref:Uncharacterized protein n=1 Tax=Petrolisthes cinctipes TaxID=88211 RepID=A0AAE1BTI6_PETCI|nr:hypothetical protein Pcinc_037068 [Petrolisthes cinctipes]
MDDKEEEEVVEVDEEEEEEEVEVVDEEEEEVEVEVVEVDEEEEVVVDEEEVEVDEEEEEEEVVVDEEEEEEEEEEVEEVVEVEVDDKALQVIPLWEVTSFFSSSMSRLSLARLFWNHVITCWREKVLGIGEGKDCEVLVDKVE